MRRFRIQKETTRHGKPVFYYRDPGRGERIRLPDDYGSEAFWAAHKAAEAESEIRNRPKTKRLAYDAAKESKDNRQRVGAALKKCMCGAKQRAKLKSKPFSLSLDWLLDRAIAIEFKCELTGIPFYTTQFGLPKNRAFSPSIDRIDCHKGYTPDNVRIVLLAVNVMVSDWGTETMDIIARSYRLKKIRARRKSVGSSIVPPHPLTHKSRTLKDENEFKWIVR
jgi:hypothetical protein